MCSCYGVLRVRLTAAVPHNFRGHSVGVTPLPIPNREVKPDSADGTRRATSRESRTPRIFFKGPERGPLFLPAGILCRPEPRSPFWVELAQPADAVGDRRVCDEQRCEALLRERVRRVERLRRRARA